MRRSRPLMSTVWPVCRDSTLSAAVAIGQIAPAIHPPPQTVDAVLLVAGVEAGEQGASLVGPAVAVGIAGEKQFAGSGDQHAVAPGHQAGRKGDVGEKLGPAVVAAVAVGILRDKQIFPPGLPLIVEAQRIVEHLGDPQLAIGPPIESHRVGDQRLGGDQLDVKAGRHVQRRQPGGRIERRRRAGGRILPGGAA